LDEVEDPAMTAVSMTAVSPLSEYEITPVVGVPPLKSALIFIMTSTRSVNPEDIERKASLIILGCKGLNAI
jgi:hypothetical protein